MRGIIGFAAGVAAGVAGVAYLGTESGRQLRERLVGQASPEIRSALEEWEPTFQEVAKAARQGMKELEAAAQSLRHYIEEQAASAGGGEGVAEDVAAAARDAADAAGEMAGDAAEAAEDAAESLRAD
jgi:methyl-accepting chemotaxis protein